MDQLTVNFTFIIATLLARQAEISAGDVFKLSFCPSQHNQTSMQLKFYSSLEKDVFYVTFSQTKSRRFKDRADCDQDAHSKRRQVDVMFSFSHTEIKLLQ